MKITVWHRREPTFFVAPSRLLNSKDYAAVAILDLPNAGGIHRQLDRAFQMTNNIDKGWWENTGVQFLGSPDHGTSGCRSTSVGDLIQVDEASIVYEVDNSGFRKAALQHGDKP